MSKYEIEINYGFTLQIDAESREEAEELALTETRAKVDSWSTQVSEPGEPDEIEIVGVVKDGVRVKPKSA